MKLVAEPQLPEWLKLDIVADGSVVSGDFSEPVTRKFGTRFLQSMAELEHMGAEMLTAAGRPRLG